MWQGAFDGHVAENANGIDKLDFYVETPNVEAPGEEDDKIEISMED